MAALTSSGAFDGGAPSSVVVSNTSDSTVRPSAFTPRTRTMRTVVRVIDTPNAMSIPLPARTFYVSSLEGGPAVNVHLTDVHVNWTVLASTDSHAGIAWWLALCLATTHQRSSDGVTRVIHTATRLMDSRDTVTITYRSGASIWTAGLGTA